MLDGRTGVTQYTIVCLYGDLLEGTGECVDMVSWCERGFLRLYDNLALAPVYAVL